jgi:hypothetical protein
MQYLGLMAWMQDESAALPEQTEFTRIYGDPKIMNLREHALG